MVRFFCLEKKDGDKGNFFTEDLQKNIASYEQSIPCTAWGWLEDLRRSQPSLSSVKVINKIYSYVLKVGVLLLGVEKRKKASKYCCHTSNGACKTSVIFCFDQGKTKTWLQKNKHKSLIWASGKIFSSYSSSPWSFFLLAYGFLSQGGKRKNNPKTA